MGASWLDKAHARLMAMPNIGLRSPLEGQFLRGIELWDSIDSILHGSVEGCALGKAGPCRPEAIVSCRACADLMSQGVLL